VNVIAGGVGIVPPAETEEAKFARILLDELKFTQAVVDNLTENGYLVFSELADWGHKAVGKYCGRKQATPLNRGGCNYGDKTIKRLQGLVWQATELKRLNRNVLLDSNTTLELADEWFEEAIAELHKVDHGMEIESPEQFTYNGWKTWERSVYNYLSGKYNLRGIPLSYVIRRETAEAVFDAIEYTVDPESCRVKAAPLKGASFRKDNQDVLKLLKSLCQGTESWKWMETAKGGRAAMIALQEHYNGSAEGERRLNITRADLKELFFKRQDTFPFEKYVSRLKECYNTLEELEVPEYETEKVRTLLDHIQCNHDEVKQCVVLARTNHPENFQAACDYLASEIARIFPDKHPTSNRFTSPNKKKRYQRDRGRNVSNTGTSNHGVKRKNGVDISDPARYYSEAEWKKLDSDTQQALRNHPKRLAKLAKKGKTASVAAATVTTQGEKNKERAETVNALISALSHVASPGNRVRFPANGSNTAVVAAVQQSPAAATPALRFDHNGDPV